MRILTGLIAIVALIGCLCSQAAWAESIITVEPIVVLRSDGDNFFDASIEGTVWRTFENSDFGISGFWWVTKDWAEVHAGPTWTPTKGLTFGLDLGGEQDGKGSLRLRYATSFWMNPPEFLHGKLSISGAFEFGNDIFVYNDWSGTWFEWMATVGTVEDLYTVGLRHRRAVGFGPFFQLNIGIVRPWILLALLDPEYKDFYIPRMLAGVTFQF